MFLLVSSGSYWFLLVLPATEALFFPPADTNEDNFLDEQELEALFTKEVRSHRKSRLPHLLLAATTHLQCLCHPAVGEGLRPQERGGRHDGDGGGAAEDEGARHEECQSLSLSLPLRLPLFLFSHLVSPWRQVDSNKDRLVSLDEFLRSTQKKDFSNPKEWEVRGGAVRGEGEEELCHTPVTSLLFRADFGHQALLHRGGAAAL